MIRLIRSKVDIKTRLVGTNCSIISNVVSLLYPHFDKCNELVMATSKLWLL